jgi:hypothetical protein
VWSVVVCPPSSCYGRLNTRTAHHQADTRREARTPSRQRGWNAARLEALRRYYEGICYRAKRSDSETARLIYDDWRAHRPRPRKNRTFSSVWAIRYRLPKVRELIWKDEEFERHCGMIGLIDQPDIDAAAEAFKDLPEDFDYYDLIPDDFEYEPDEY